MARIARFASFAVLAVTLTLGATACSSGSGDSGSSDSSSTGIVAPVIVDLADADGTTVIVPLDNVVDLVTGDDEDVTAWTADIDDSAIVEFTPGKDDGSAQFNPGLTPLEVGETEVVLTNSTSDTTVTFTVQVTE
ncbi:hypothetical protein CLV54_0296 [Compostimonas suwonensis]|uniref:MSP domain-containing protein n=1 Tax=Compostimonas suwonensis TaxID=1048394 RepID=A0A2M9C474_9MICO|nr:hypothetical protein CLV54_0296 [Compostimonas suwonensis]